MGKAWGLGGVGGGRGGVPLPGQGSGGTRTRGGAPGTRISLCGGSEVCAAAGLGVGRPGMCLQPRPGKSVGAAGKCLRETFTRSARVLTPSSSTKTKALAILIVKHPWTPTAA